MNPHMRTILPTLCVILLCSTQVIHAGTGGPVGIPTTAQFEASTSAAFGGDRYLLIWGDVHSSREDDIYGQIVNTARRINVSTKVISS